MSYSLPPEKVYKYRNAKWGLELLRSKTLYFNKPTSFDDSNDCNLGLMDFNNPPVKYIKGIFDKTSNYNRREKRDKVKEYTRNPKEFIEYCKNGFQKNLDRLRVSCFSKRPNIKRLWEEYADNGRGLCFCFNSRIEPKHLTVMECTYFDTLPKFNYFKYREEGEKESDLMSFFSCKLKPRYGFEEEVRIFHFLGEENIKFDPVLLEEVILGINIEKETVERVLQLLKAPEFSHVKVRKVFDYDNMSFIDL